MNNSLAEVHPELITEWSEKNHTVLHQVLQIAVDDDFIRNNPSDNVLRELKKAHCFQSEKRRALTKLEQELFLNFMKAHPVYEHWYPVFAVMRDFVNNLI